MRFVFHFIRVESRFIPLLLQDLAAVCTLARVFTCVQQRFISPSCFRISFSFGIIFVFYSAPLIHALSVSTTIRARISQTPANTQHFWVTTHPLSSRLQTEIRFTRVSAEAGVLQKLVVLLHGDVASAEASATVAKLLVRNEYCKKVTAAPSRTFVCFIRSFVCFGLVCVICVREASPYFCSCWS